MPISSSFSSRNENVFPVTSSPASVFSMTGLDIGAAVMGLTEIIICFLETRSMNNKLGALAEMSDVVKEGAGCYLLYAGGALLLIGGIIGIIIKRRKA